MQFILKDGYIYLVKNEIPENNKFEGNVVIKYVDNFENKKFYFSVNNKKYRPIVNETITLEDEDLAGPYIELIIKAVNKDEVDVFKSDRLPLTRSIIVGEKIEDVYPNAINGLNQHIEKVYERLQDQVKRLEKRIKDLEEVGDLI